MKKWKVYCLSAALGIALACVPGFATAPDGGNGSAPSMPVEELRMPMPPALRNDALQTGHTPDSPEKDGRIDHALKEVEAMRLYAVQK
ncbi:hypothetical protein LJC27_04870 [Christensenellaceae bacterium OttesenSCG-928-M15]|nr:hypothetical protein [Christensenellaceae bacterium OttesenSCG-928-M15]